MLATDFSDCADNALEYAAKIAITSKSRVSLLNAFEVPVVAPVNVFTSLEDTVHHVTQEIQASASAKLRKLQSRMECLTVDVQTEEGKP